jgi:hypothetical protein
MICFEFRCYNCIEVKLLVLIHKNHSISGCYICEHLKSLYKFMQFFNILVKKRFCRHGHLCSRARRVQDFWTRTRFIEYFRTRTRLVKVCQTRLRLVKVCQTRLRLVKVCQTRIRPGPGLPDGLYSAVTRDGTSVDVWRPVWVVKTSFISGTKSPLILHLMVFFT